MEEWLLEVCGETRKIAAWNKLTYKVVVAKSYVNTPSSKCKYMLRRPAVLDMWCGDRNGMEPYMPHEQLKHICSSAWQLIDDIQVPVVKENQYAVTFLCLLPDDIKADSLRDALETFLSSTTWWKDSVHVSKYSAEVRFSRQNSGPKHDTIQVQKKYADRVNHVPVTSAAFIAGIDAVSESPRSEASSFDSEYSSLSSACRSAVDGQRNGNYAESLGGRATECGDAQTGVAGQAPSGGKDGATLTDVAMTKRQKSEKEMLLKATKVRC
jgi:hypothetical protein